MQDVKAVAKKAVMAIVDDICDRQGLKWDWYKADEGLLTEMQAAWQKILEDSHLELIDLMVCNERCG